MPYYVCTETNNQCVLQCDGDSTCQSECRSKTPCGAQDPKRVNVTTTAATVTPTASETPLNTGSTGAAPRMAPLSHVYGLCIFGGIVAGLTTLL